MHNGDGVTTLTLTTSAPAAPANLRPRSHLRVRDEARGCDAEP
jgi:hypothetical protein